MGAGNLATEGNDRKRNGKEEDDRERWRRRSSIVRRNAEQRPDTQLDFRAVGNLSCPADACILKYSDSRTGFFLLPADWFMEVGSQTVKNHVACRAFAPPWCAAAAASARFPTDATKFGAGRLEGILVDVFTCRCYFPAVIFPLSRFPIM